MRFVEVDCVGCGSANTARLDTGRECRCAQCGMTLCVAPPSTVPPDSSPDAAAFDEFFERVAVDLAARADEMLRALPALPTGLRRRAGSMGRWMASWLLRQLDEETLPPGIEPYAYRREELAVHLAGASVAVGLMEDPFDKAVRVRRSLYRAVGCRRGFSGAAELEHAAATYAHALSCGDLAAVGLLGGRRATRGVVGEGLVVAGASLTFVAAWCSAAWSRTAPTCTIR